MKGHVVERSPGKWAIVLDIYGEDGKRRRKWHTFHTTSKRKAEEECARLVASITGGTYIEPTKQTLAGFLDEWLEFVRPSVTPKTWERYAELCRKTIAPQLGTVVLSKLRTDRIDAGLSKMRVAGRRGTGGGLSPRTVGHARRVLIKALGQAVVWGRLLSNPAAATTPPKVGRAKMTAYDATQTVALLSLMRPTRMFIPVLLAVMCGLRRGEIAALRWGAIDLDGKNLAVVESAEQTADGVDYKEPKSGRARTVALSGTVVAELRAHRVRQAEELLRLGLRPDASAFVVAQADGSPLQPRSITHEWVRLLAKAPLPRIRFHDLRHSHASQMLAAGVHPKIASERLGHSTIAITLDLYSHVMPGMQADAAEQVDAAIRRAVKAGDKDVR